MRKKQTIGSIMLLMTSIIWGCAFVAQKVGMDYIGPFSFCGFRFLFSASFLIIITICRDFIFYKKLSLFQMEKQKRKKVFLGGILCGVSLAIASVLQQYSMQGTTAGKAGFITALYIVLVPILGMFIKKKVIVGYRIFIDGEILEEGLPVDISIVPEALNLIILRTTN